MSGAGLDGARRKAGRGLAHHLKPVIHVGRQGLTPALVAETSEALLRHELIKVKFVEHKEERTTLAAELAAGTGAELLGVIGNIAILYRAHPDPAERKVRL